MDGWVTIGTKLDNAELEKDLKAAESELKRFEREGEKLATAKAKVETNIQEYERQKQLIQEATDEELKRLQTEDQVTFALEGEKLQLEQLNQQYSKEFDGLKDINKKIQENTHSQSMMKQQVEEMNQKLRQTKGFDGIKHSIDKIGDSMSNVINKVVRWGFAIFGIRSAYMGVRRVISLVSEHNEKIANSFQQISSVIAGALLPVAQAAVNAIAKVMVYINYIWKALTGKNLFNFADATKKAEKNLKSGAGSSRKISDNLKEARKQLAGFDEMNVLNDNVDAAGGGGGVGGAGGIGDTDFPNIFDKLSKMKIPDWLEKLKNILLLIKKYWKEILPIVAAFAAAIAAMKIASFVRAITGATTSLAKFKGGFALAAAGAVLLAGEIINMILNWDKMSKKEKILSAALAVLGAAFIALGYAIATGISVATLGIGALIALVVGLVSAIVGYIAKLAKEEKAIKSVKKATEDLTAAKKKAKEAEDEYVSAVDNANEKFKALKKVQKETGISGEELYKKVQQGTLDYKNMNKQQKEVYKAYLDHINAQDRLKKATEDNTKAKHDLTMKTWEEKLAVAADKGEYEKYRDSVVQAFKDGKLSAKDAQKLISKSMTDMSKDSEKTFTKDIPKDIKDGIDPDKYRTKWQIFKSDWKNNLAKLVTKITLTISFPTAASLTKAWNSVMKIFKNNSTVELKTKSKKTTKKKNAKGAIYYPSRLPKLAAGGIINKPGSGIPYNGAIIGEHGAEAVVPLTDSQQMELLGASIGKYIIVNANITNTMNGRVISRELQKVQNDSDFAYNR